MIVPAAAVLAAGTLIAVTFLAGGRSVVPGLNPAARAAAPPNPHDDGFGYTAAFDAERQRIGQVAPAEVAVRHPPPADAVAGRLPPRPEWTRAYLVPGVNLAARTYAPREGA
jgi:hypothetical protein